VVAEVVPTAAVVEAFLDGEAEGAFEDEEATWEAVQIENKRSK